MPVSASTLRKLMEAGLEGDALLDVVASIDADASEAPKPRSAAAIRQQRYRERKADASVTSDVTSDVTGHHVVKESPPKPPKENSKENPPKGGQKKNAVSALQTVLSEAVAKAVVEHRQRIKKPLTEHAAHLLAKRLSQAPDAGFTPEQAADLMIEKGWQSIEVEWLSRCKPPPSAPTKSDSENMWATRLNFGRTHRKWSTAEWGPMPGQPNCRAPPHLLEPGDGDGWNELERAA